MTELTFQILYNVAISSFRGPNPIIMILKSIVNVRIVGLQTRQGSLAKPIREIKKRNAIAGMRFSICIFISGSR